jgi:hypothetical protein
MLVQAIQTPAFHHGVRGFSFESAEEVSSNHPAVLSRAGIVGTLGNLLSVGNSDWEKCQGGWAIPKIVSGTLSGTAIGKVSESIDIKAVWRGVFDKPQRS